MTQAGCGGLPMPVPRLRTSRAAAALPSVPCPPTCVRSRSSAPTQRPTSVTRSSSAASAVSSAPPIRSWEPRLRGLNSAPACRTTWCATFAMTESTTCCWPAAFGRGAWTVANLSAFVDAVVDTTPPQVTGQTPAAGATITTTNSVNIDVTFSEFVIGVDATDLVLSGAAAAGRERRHAHEPQRQHLAIPGLGTGQRRPQHQPGARRQRHRGYLRQRPQPAPDHLELHRRDQQFVFTNTNGITIPIGGAATPYPSNIVVSGLSGTITKVTATLTNFSHTWPDDVDILLVGPAGQKLVLMSDAGGTNANAVTNLTFTFDDAAASACRTTVPSLPAPSGRRTSRLGDGFPARLPLGRPPGRPWRSSTAPSPTASGASMCSTMMASATPAASAAAGAWPSRWRRRGRRFPSTT